MKSIVSETDLTYYENKLQGMSCPVKEATPPADGTQSKSFKEHMLMQKGKLIKVEIQGGNCVKVGTLLDVGSDYICLRAGKEPVSVLIPFCRVRTVTVAHCNNRFAAFSY